MKSRMAIWLFAALFVTAMTAPVAGQEVDDPVTVTFEVKGFHCPLCAKNLQAFVEELDGVTEVSASYEESRLTVTFDPALQSVQTLTKAVAENTGFVIEEIPLGAESNS